MYKCGHALYVHGSLGIDKLTIYVLQCKNINLAHLSIIR